MTSIRQTDRQTNTERETRHHLSVCVCLSVCLSVCLPVCLSGFIKSSKKKIPRFFLKTAKYGKYDGFHEKDRKALEMKKAKTAIEYFGMSGGQGDKETGDWTPEGAMAGRNLCRNICFVES